MTEKTTEVATVREAQYEKSHLVRNSDHAAAVEMGLRQARSACGVWVGIDDSDPVVLPGFAAEVEDCKRCVRAERARAARALRGGQR